MQHGDLKANCKGDDRVHISIARQKNIHVQMTAITVFVMIINEV